MSTRKLKSPKSYEVIDGMGLKIFAALAIVHGPRKWATPVKTMRVSL